MIEKPMDFRSHLNLLEENKLLVKIKKTVSTRYELAAVLKKVQNKLSKAAFFENVKGYGIPVVGNIIGNLEMLALAFGTTKDKVAENYADKLDRRLNPMVVKTGPIKEVIKTGENIDILNELPVVTHHERDAGPYISAGIATAKWPGTKLQNLSFNRLQVVGKNKCHIRMMPPQHLGQIQKKAEKAGKVLEVAVVLGADLFTMFSSSTKLPYGDDHLQLAGALLGKPIEVVKCETIDVMIPANAEVVIEGEVPPNVREPEGPWADLMEYYIPVMKNHVFNVKAITHRKKPIYYTIPGPSLDCINFQALPHEARIFRAIKMGVPTVKAVRIFPVNFNCFVSIKKEFEGEAKNAIMAAFGVDNWLKTCVVVDDDVDIFDSNDVLWAISTRARLEKGVFIVSDAYGFPRDPYRLHRVKVGIDATLPLDVPKEEFERARIPGEENINLKNYLA